MDKLSQLIPVVLNKRGLGAEAKASHVTYLTTDWIHAHMEPLLQYIRVTSYKDGTLTLSCQNSIASQELSQKSEELTAYLSEAAGLSSLQIRIIRA